RVDPRVVAAMLPVFDSIYGNAASTSHSFGWAAAELVEESAATIAGHLGADPREIVFTSGATEAINLAIKGVAPGLEKNGRHCIASLAEHKAGIDPVKRLAKQGWDVTWLRPDPFGAVSAEQVAAAIRADTVLVSVMLANNEIGTISPIGEISRVCHERSILIHTDATQAVGKIPVNVDELGADLLSFSAHKFYGPRGIGGLYVRRRDRPVRLAAQIEGGGHQRGLRSGTLPVPLVVGMATALAISVEQQAEESSRLANLRNTLENKILDRLEGVGVNGLRDNRLPNTSSLTFEGVAGEALMLAMKDLAVSSGSACSAADPEPSHVLRAIGLTDDAARSTLRFSLGRFNTADDVEFAAERVIETVNHLRNLRKLV
ncbi:MAG: cysteine desulfurase family protein, partial [Isosphaeraceae bacterium]